MGEDQAPDKPSNMAVNIHAAMELIERARAGDRHAIKDVMFPFHYGQKRDEETGEMRRYTPEEIEEARKRLIG